MGFKEGQGILTKPNGFKYQGTFFKDLFEGLGEEWWPDGTHYKGEYHQGLKHGDGRL